MLPLGALVQDRYRIVRLVDQNAVHAVYEATDQKFGTAILIRQWFSGGAETTRGAFVREARLLNTLYHGALPYVFDMFSDSGSLFMASQHVPGESLARLIDQRGAAFDVDLALEWGAKLLDLLDYLHTRTPRIVHCNLVPASLRITPRGDIVVVDFSLALDYPGTALSYTLPYAPHEQIQGQPVDPRADVYSLAATLYHLLTGKPPANAFQRAAHVAAGKPDLPAADEVNRAVPRHVGKALELALAIREDERLASAAQFREALAAPATFQARVPARAEGPAVPGSPDLSDAPTVELDAGQRDDVAETQFGGPTVMLPEGLSLAQSPGAESGSFTVALDPTVALSGPILGDLAAVRPRGPRTTVICRTCGAANDPIRVFCPHCGSLLRVDASGAASHDEVAPVPGAAPPEDLGPTIDLAEQLPPTAKVVASPLPPTARLTVIDGEECGRTMDLRTTETLFGRDEGDFTFPLDIFMSGRHARVAFRDGTYVISDVGSRNGTFIRLTGEVELNAGDVVLAGKQLLRFDPGPPPLFQLLQYSGEVGLTFGLRTPETIVGRGRGDLTFPDDLAMADAHFRVIERAGRFFASDCGSRNGTYLKITSEHALRDGDIVIFGKHVLRFTLSRTEHFDVGDTAPV